MIRPIYKWMTIGILLVGALSAMAVSFVANPRLGWLAFTGAGSYNDGGSHPPETQIVWSPASVDETATPGQVETVSITFVASENLSRVSIIVSPKIASLVRVEPSLIERIEKNESNTLKITVRPHAGSTLGTFVGTVTLQEDPAGREKRKALSKALPVTVNVWAKASEPSIGLSFQVPPLGGVTRLETTTPYNGVTRLAFQVKRPGQEEFVSAFLMGVYENPSRLSLHDWFEENVDENSLLLANHAFEEMGLSNGVVALVLSGPIPSQYRDLRGPIMTEAYMLSPNGDRVVSIVHSEETILFDLGYSNQQVRDLMLEVLATAQL